MQQGTQSSSNPGSVACQSSLTWAPFLEWRKRRRHGSKQSFNIIPLLLQVTSITTFKDCQDLFKSIGMSKKHGLTQGSQGPLMYIFFL